MTKAIKHDLIEIDDSKSHFNGRFSLKCYGHFDEMFYLNVTSKLRLASSGKCQMS